MPNEASVKDVIVADNDAIIRSILRSVLEGEGFTVLPGIDGFEAVDIARRTQASLVILDYKMPHMDGITACSEIRQLPGYAATPIVILTAFGDSDTRRAANAAGISAFLTKPFTPIEVLRTAGGLLGYSIAALAQWPPPLVWKRRQEPKPLFGEPSEFSNARRLLNICRR
ncbi:MAG TPA: response regulator [Acetobacteraceae bacterium]|jgi:CheY-like chemotaxis protein|nr:response regulator [Acetobacteraceae bacterium]